MAGVSIAGLFLGGIIPGLLMGLGLMIINYFICKKRKYPKNEHRPKFKALLISLLYATPPLLTPIIILGGIVLGIFTPTEAALIASLYAFFLGYFVYKELTIKGTLKIFLEVLKTTSSIMIIIAFAGVFARILTQQGVPQQIGSILTSITTNTILILLIINIFLLILGCFMDVIASLIAVTPMLLPVIDTLQISRLHFGVILVLNLTIALNTPPMGASLFVATKIAKTKIEETFLEMIPFLIVLIGVLFLITYIPSLVTYIPSVLM
jgi:C4-dicarboxylate transporter DctM subunit